MADQNMLSQIFGRKSDINEDIKYLNDQKALGHVSQETYLKSMQDLVNQLPKTNSLSETRFASPAPEAIPEVAKVAPAPTEDPLAKYLNPQLNASSMPEDPLASFPPSIAPVKPVNMAPSLPQKKPSPVVTDSVDMSQSAPQEAAPAPGIVPPATSPATSSTVADELQRLKDAENADKMTQAGASILRGAEKASAGTAQVAGGQKITPDLEEANALLKDPTRARDQLRKQLTDEQSVLERDVKRSTLDFEKQKVDPNSELSKNARGVLKAALKKANLGDIPIRENASLAELEKEYTWMKDLMETNQAKEMLSIRRGDQALARELKADEKTTARIVAGYNVLKKDIAKKEAELLDPIADTKTLLAQTKNNTLAWAAVTAKLPRILGEKGVLTDSDITRYSTSPQWAARFNQMRKSALEGKPEPLMVEDVKNIIAAMEAKAKDDIGERTSAHLRATKNQNKNVPMTDLRASVDPQGYGLDWDVSQVVKKDYEKAKKDNPNLTQEAFARFIKNKMIEQGL